MFNTPYQSYMPYGANNYMQRGYAPQQQPMAQPQMQSQPQPQMQAQPPMTYDMPIQDIKFVNKAQAEAYIVFPNTKVMLLDTESGIAYIKTADGMGQSKTDYYHFEQVNADGTPLKPQETSPKVDFDEFVKKEQLKAFGFVTFDEHKKVLAELDTIKKMLSGNKMSGKTESAKGGHQ